MAKLLSSPDTKPYPTIIQSSADASTIAHTAQWGLVSAVVEAYNRHHELVLRPDDVWQAILTQFSFYVNANAEALRDKFVDFEGKKTLVIMMGGTLFSANFGEFANRMVDEQICPNLKDKDVTDWLLPGFSTTQSSDRVAASVTIMSTLQSYFEYVCCLMCGIPEVTLEGTAEDWAQLRAKIDRLPLYAVEGQTVMQDWHNLLAPVLDEFVAAKGGKPDLAFWDRVCDRSGGGSGPTYLSGWVTVFACFTSKGNWQGDITKRPFCFGAPFADAGEKKKKKDAGQWLWPVIDMDRLPVGCVSVPVLVDDNGVQYDTQMVAGQFCYGAEGDTVRPRNDWCIAYEGAPRAEPRYYKQGEVRPRNDWCIAYES